MDKPKELCEEKSTSNLFKNHLEVCMCLLIQRFIATHDGQQWGQLQNLKKKKKKQQILISTILGFKHLF